MRFSLGACSGLLCALLAVTPSAARASEITFPAVAGGDMAFDRVFGEILTSIPDQRVDDFSFWLVDPGSSTGLNYRMGICSTSAGRPASIVFETDAQTLTSTTSGAARQVTASTGGLVLDPTVYYFFYLLPTEPMTAPWGIQTTLTNYGPGGRGGKMGLTQWNEDKLNNDILEMPFDRDFAFSATFSDPTLGGPQGGPVTDPQSVPEPSVLVLMGLGGAALLNAKRRSRSTNA
jgi:hypothetical protein